MKRLLTYIQLLLVTAIVASTLQSCIKDDLADCPSEIRVFFDYTKSSSSVSLKDGINPDSVTSINLYVFDSKDVFIGEYPHTNPKIEDEDFYIPIPKLPNGTYRIVAWGSLSGQYNLLPEEPVVGETKFKDFQLHFKDFTDSNKTTVTRNLTPIYFGTIKNLEIKSQNTITDARVRLIQNTYKINVTVKGQIDTRSSHNLIITDNNDKYGFDNAYLPAPYFDYVVDARKVSENEIKGEIDIMRIDEKRSPILKIINKDKGQTLFNEDLVQMIQYINDTYAGVEIDYSSMHEFDLVITINKGSFTVTINGWIVIDGDEVLHQ